jgi:hypothetical protein
MEVAVRYRIVLLVSLLLAYPYLESRAECFSIIGEKKDWTYVPGTTLNYLIGIENLNESPDLLMLWDLNLTISPAPTETTGDLFIVKAYQPSKNYLLEKRQGQISPEFSGPLTSIALINDADGIGYGVSVPKTGKYLLELELQPTTDAQGTFNITVQPDEFSAFWATYDVTSGQLIAHEFDKLPFDSLLPPVMIGSVTIHNVPEPASIAILTIGMLCIFGRRLRCRTY